MLIKYYLKRSCIRNIECEKKKFKFKNIVYYMIEYDYEWFNGSEDVCVFYKVNL